MLFNSCNRKTAAGCKNKRKFLKDCNRYELPITPHGKITGLNWYTIAHIGLALIITELQKFEILLPTCRKFLDLIDIKIFDAKVASLGKGNINELIVMIPSSYEVEVGVFLAVAIS